MVLELLSLLLVYHIYRCWFMDDSDAEIGAISKVFPNSMIRLCFWHLTEAWKRWLRANVNDPSIRDEVSNTLRCIAHTPKPVELQTLWKALCSRLDGLKLEHVREHMFCFVAVLDSSHVFISRKQHILYAFDSQVKHWILKEYMSAAKLGKWTVAHLDLAVIRLFYRTITNNPLERLMRTLKYVYIHIVNVVIF